MSRTVTGKNGKKKKIKDGHTAQYDRIGNAYSVPAGGRLVHNDNGTATVIKPRERAVKGTDGKYVSVPAGAITKIGKDGRAVVVKQGEITYIDQKTGRVKKRK